MRVIAGQAKGHRLKCIEGLNTRPTQDRVKESIFNIIMNYIYGSKVLDLFSGTGNLAIEALSRGAEFAVMIDNNDKAAGIIHENINHTKFDNISKVVCIDALSYIKMTDEKFDLIFLDPPYSKGFIQPILDEIYFKKVLTEDGLIVAEYHKNDQIDSPFSTARQQLYGDTMVAFLKY